MSEPIRTVDDVLAYLRARLKAERLLRRTMAKAGWEVTAAACNYTATEIDSIIAEITHRRAGSDGEGTDNG